jgi:hypothetical protein
MPPSWPASRRTCPVGGSAGRSRHHPARKCPPPGGAHSGECHIGGPPKVELGGSGWAPRLPQLAEGGRSSLLTAVACPDPLRTSRNRSTTEDLRCSCTATRRAHAIEGEDVCDRIQSKAMAQTERAPLHPCRSKMMFTMRSTSLNSTAFRAQDTSTWVLLFLSISTARRVGLKSINLRR